MKLSIIIINYKSEEFIERCLECIYFDREYEIIILDNEGNPELMKRLSGYPRVRIIPFEQNFGFAEGNNIAIRQAKGEFICTLNADVFMTRDYLDKCVYFLENNFNYSSVQGKFLLQNKAGYIDSTGNMMTKSRFAQNINHRERDYDVPSGEVFGVCAAAAIYRKKDIYAIELDSGIFDADFFAYLEDVDLDWRLRLIGKKAYFLADALAYHIRESSSNKFFRIKQALRNRLFMIIKNDTRFSLILNLLIFIPVLIIVPGSKENFSLIFRMFRKREIIRKRRKISHQKLKKHFKKTPWQKMIRKLLNI